MAGRPRNRVHIVDAFLQDSDILAIVPHLITLGGRFHDKISTLEWFAERRLISNSVNCPTCNELCTLSQYNSQDGFRWRCFRHNFTQSVRVNSFFEGAKVSLDTAIVLLYCWAADFLQLQIQRETLLSGNSVSIWCTFLRDVCENVIENNPQELGGFDENNEPIEVEIDESKFFHRKYHRGLWREGHWVFGAIERRSKQCILVEVPDRAAATLEPIIRRWILPGSHIISDGWAAYANIDQIGNGIYTHSVVVHERHFVDPDHPAIHTQLIENTWMRAKKKLRRQHGTSVDLFSSYMAEFMWRSRVGGNKFAEFLLAIRQLYPF